MRVGRCATAPLPLVAGKGVELAHELARRAGVRIAAAALDATPAP